MNCREIIPLKQGLDFKLTLPGSKSITNRALLCAALAKGKSRLYGALESDDTAVMLNALRKLKIRSSKFKNRIEIEGCGGKFIKGNFTFDLHNAGTATRFLTAIMCVREGATVITGDSRMRERPIADLVEGLRQIGADIEYLDNAGFPPLRINSPFVISICPRRKKSLDSPSKSESQGISRQARNDKRGYIIKMKGDKSSQYFSALLMLGPLLDRPLKIEVIGDLVSKPYIDITISVLRAFGIKVINNNYKSFTVKPQEYKAADYYIEGDASAASYWTSIAYLHGGRVKFTNLTSRSIQGDIGYERVLKKAGVVLTANKNMGKKGCNPICHLYGSRIKSGMTKSGSVIEVDMNEMPDSAMTLAVTAPFLRGRTKITGLSTLRIKETDRLVALERELNKIGVHSSTTLGMKNGIKDSITIWPTTWATTWATIRTYNDHRMAMCFAVIGTKIPGIVIENPGCTDKTYPDFWEDLERMYLSKKIRLGKKNLVLTGMRCSGKTCLGRKIAQLLDRTFVDLDEEIEKKEGMTTSGIVKKHGWDYFRKVEQKVCSYCSQSENLVIATGGGAVLNSENMKNLKKNGINVFIFADPSVLAQRIAKKTGIRPSLTNKNPVDEIKEVWLKRRDLYLKYADYVWDNTGGEVIGENLKRVLKN